MDITEVHAPTLLDHAGGDQRITGRGSAPGDRVGLFLAFLDQVFERLEARSLQDIPGRRRELLHVDQFDIGCLHRAGLFNGGGVMRLGADQDRIAVIRLLEEIADADHPAGTFMILHVDLAA
jgi:hypothetical protein